MCQACLTAAMKLRESHTLPLDNSKVYAFLRAKEELIPFLELLLHLVFKYHSEILQKAQTWLMMAVTCGNQTLHVLCL